MPQDVSAPASEPASPEPPSVFFSNLAKKLPTPLPTPFVGPKRPPEKAAASGPPREKDHTREKDHRSMSFFPYFAVGAGVCCCAMASFAYMSANTPAGTQTTLSPSDPNCSWWVEARRLNPFGCFRPRFTSSPLAPPVARTCTCRGPRLEALFETHCGADAACDLGEARALMRALASDVTNNAACESASPGAKPSHVCFAHVTATEKLEKAHVGPFAECVVGRASAECCASVCV
jgi:hypothetical protein